MRRHYFLGAFLLFWMGVQPLIAQRGISGMTEIHLEPLPFHMAVVDLDGNGSSELLSVRDHVVTLVQFDSGDGSGSPPRIESEEGRVLTNGIPGAASLWTVADYDGDGQDEFLALVNGESLLKLQYGDGVLQWSEPILQGVGADKKLPVGVRPADFVRDLNGDDIADLAVPLGAKMRLFFGNKNGGFDQGPDLEAATRLELQTGHGYGGLMERVSRRLVVPKLTMQDVSGDAVADLQVSDATKIRQYITKDGVLPGQATRTVDLDEFKDLLGELEWDPGNITGTFAKRGIWEEFADLNNDGALDMILLVGGNVVIYLGGPSGINVRARAADVARVRGNVMYALASRVDDDPYPDLILIKAEDVSLTQGLSWLIFSVSFEVDVLAFKGLGKGRFRKKPMPQSKIGLEIEAPNLLDLYRDRNKADPLRRTVTRLADFDGDGVATDLVMLDEKGNLTGYYGLLRDASVLDQHTDRFIADLLRAEEVLELDVETMAGWLFGRASLLVSLAHKNQPDFRLPAPEDWVPPHAMTVSDFNGDGKDEILYLRRTRNQATEDERARRALVGAIVDPLDP